MKRIEDDRVVAVPTWDELPKIEKDLLICAFEASGVLPYACTRDFDGRHASDADVVGRIYNSRGPVIARADLDAVMADPATWADPPDLSWDGVVTLSETDAGRRITRTSR